MTMAQLTTTTPNMLFLFLLLSVVSSTAFVATPTFGKALTTTTALASTLAPVPPHSSPSSSPTNIHVLSGFQDMRSLVDQAETDQLVVINFHASYCRVCQRIQIKYKKLANVNHDNNIAFASMESSKIPAKQLRRLGIVKYPFVQIWRNAKCVASFGPGGRLYWSRVNEAIDNCKQQTEWKEVEEEFANRETALRELALQQHVLKP